MHMKHPCRRRSLPHLGLLPDIAIVSAPHIKVIIFSDPSRSLFFPSPSSYPSLARGLSFPFFLSVVMHAKASLLFSVLLGAGVNAFSAGESLAQEVADLKLAASAGCSGRRLPRLLSSDYRYVKRRVLNRIDTDYSLYRLLERLHL